jgi:hypothetical protein
LNKGKLEGIVMFFFGLPGGKVRFRILAKKGNGAK